ncbi:predicted protein [Thalassiosira pseudonana CCMP1335]|uniref:NAD(P)-binding domain-containing protein n=1 Tax=Thalassiosira pseudonana TaxID=35128 RepID=B8CFY7_THAPS|nr:predicted protein [Thalassiosira pseudonana CCMP1335]EED87875.1 predicted protein [Thalassiosira pseudonana CCMP1335]
MKISAVISLLCMGSVTAFAPSLSHHTRASTSSLYASTDGENNQLSRRAILSNVLASTTASLLTPLVSFADDAAPSSTATKVVVAGATGQTGRRILERLAAQPNLSVVAGVRNVEKASKSLSEESTVVRGAMVQKIPSLDAAGVELKKLDVSESADSLAATLSGADSLVIAVGFVPGNPLKMNAAAHEVDNIGTCNLIDAAKSAGVKKIVLVSSILTNARNWGQEKSPGFIVTNAFGNVLDEKLVAENHLKASGIDYTIVRPGGLKAKPPSGSLRISGEDTLVAGEISRDLVADVCVASLTDKKASNKVLEIIEDEETEPKVFNGLNM